LFEYGKNRRIKKQEKSVAIAEKYAEKITPSVSLIKYVIELDPELKHIVDKIPRNTVQTFASFELSEFIDKKDRMLFIGIVNQTFDEIIDAAVKCCSSSSEKKAVKADSKKAAAMYGGDLKNKTLAAIMIDTLNNLESISMSIASEAADPDRSYQILQRTFLSSVRNLIVLICNQNANSTDKLFPNITHVYNKWVIRRAKEYEREKSNYLKNGSIRAV